MDGSDREGIEMEEGFGNADTATATAAANTSVIINNDNDNDNNDDDDDTGGRPKTSKVYVQASWIQYKR